MMDSKSDRRVLYQIKLRNSASRWLLQDGSNMTGTDLYVNKPHCAAAVRP